MDIEKDLLDQSQATQEPYERSLLPECILVDKVFDSCFQRECEPSKLVDLPCFGDYKNINVVYGPGFIIDGTLKITPTATNYARVRFVFRVPFTVKVYDQKKKDTIKVSDYVEFPKDIKVFLPRASSEFSFKIVIETRSETLCSQIVGEQISLSIGVFIIVKVVGTVQLLVQSLGYCPTPRKCDEYLPDDVCDIFEEKPLPPFFPPSHFPSKLEDMDDIS